MLGNESLTQENALSLDIRNIMAQQLSELQSMSTKMDSDSSFVGSSPTYPGGLLSKPYIDESHSENMNRVYAAVRDQEKLREGIFSKPLTSVVDAVGARDLVSLYASGGLVSGQGVTQSDIEMAKLNVQQSITGKIFEKLPGGANLAGDIAGTGLASSLLGTGFMSSLGIGALAGVGTEWLVRQGAEEVKMYQEYQKRMLEDSDRFINFGESGDQITRGFSKKERKSVARFMTSLNSEFDIEDQELMEFYQAASDNNLLKSVSDVESFEKKMTKMVGVAKTFAKSMGKNMTEIAAMMGELERAGVTDAGMAGVLNFVEGNAAGFGMSDQQYVNFLSDRANRSTTGTGADAGVTAAKMAGMDTMVGEALESIKSSGENSLFSNYILNLGAEGVIQGFGSLESTNPEILDVILQASYNSDSNRIDKSKFSAYVKNVMSGKATYDDIANDVSLSPEQMGIFGLAAKSFRAQNPAEVVQANMAGMLEFSGLSMDELLSMDEDEAMGRLASFGASEDASALAVLLAREFKGDVVGESRKVATRERLRSVADSIPKSLWETMFTRDYMPQSILSANIDQAFNLSDPNMNTEDNDALLKTAYLSLGSSANSEEAKKIVAGIIKRAEGRMDRSDIDSFIQNKYGLSSEFSGVSDAENMRTAASEFAAVIMGDSDAATELRESMAAAAGAMDRDDIKKIIQGARGEKDQDKVSQAVLDFIEQDSSMFSSGANPDISQKELAVSHRSMLSAIEENSKIQKATNEELIKFFEENSKDMTGLLDAISSIQ